MDDTNEDTLALYREFLEACSVYKQLPLQLQLELRNSTNFVTGSDDTARYEASFYLNDKSSYVRFGELEQFVNDSVALLVSDNLKRMILFSDAKAVADQMKRLVNPVLKDSNALVLSKRFTGKVFKQGELIRLQLNSRNSFPPINLPKETVELQYSKEGKIISQVLTTKRTLIPLDSAMYELAKAKPELSQWVFQIPEKGYFLLKEQKGSFVYKSIRHEADALAPATVNDRIQRAMKGEYTSTKSHENYAITLN